MNTRLVFVLVAGCSGIHTDPIHANSSDGPAIDADQTENPPSEVRLEWIRNAAGNSTARATAFFYQTVAGTGFTPSPGCTDLRQHPAAPAATYLDVGGVAVTSGADTELVLTRTTSGEDPLGYAHDLWWTKPADFAANDGATYFSADRQYDVVLAGTSDVASQTLSHAGYMPAAFTVAPPADSQLALPAGDLDLTFALGGNANLPLDTSVGLAVTFTSPSFTDGDGIQLPIMTCELNGTTELIVPTEVVDVVRGYGSGDMLRQVIARTSRQLQLASVELGATVEVSTSFVYDTPWSAN